MLAIAALLGIGVASALAATAKTSPGGALATRRTPRMLVRGLVVPVVVLGVVGRVLPVLDRSPLSRGRSRSRSIPRYWDRAFDYLEAQEQPGRVLVLPGAEQARHRWGHVHDTLFDGLSPAAPLINRVLPQGTAESADLVAAIDEYVSFDRLRRGHARADPSAARRAVGAAAERPRLAADGRPPPIHLRPPSRRSGSAPRGHVRPSGPEHHRRRRRHRCRVARGVVAAAGGDLRGRRHALAATAAGSGPPAPGRGGGRLLALAGDRRSAGWAAGRLHRRRRGRRAAGDGRLGRRGRRDRRQPQTRDPGDERAPTSVRRPSPSASRTIGHPPISSAAPRPRAWPPTPMRRRIFASRYGDALRPTKSPRVRRTPSTASSAPPGCCGARRPRRASR